MPRNADLSGLMERDFDLDQSVAHIQKRYPDFRRDSIEECLIDWIDMDYALRGWVVRYKVHDLHMQRHAGPRSRSNP